MGMTEDDGAAARQATIEAVLRRMVADREARIAALEERLAVLEATLQTTADRLAAAEERGAMLERLRDTLVWPGGPRALRLALPLARLIRRLTPG